MNCDTAYITQSEAKRLLKQTGRTLAEIDAMVAGLPKQPCGKREKVHRSQVMQLVAKHAVPPPPSPVVKTSIRGLNPRHREAFARYDRVQQVMEQVRSIAER